LNLVLRLNRCGHQKISSSFFVSISSSTANINIRSQAYICGSFASSANVFLIQTTWLVTRFINIRFSYFVILRPIPLGFQAFSFDVASRRSIRYRRESAAARRPIGTSTLGCVRMANHVQTIHESAALILRAPMTLIHCKNRASLFAQLEAEIFTRLSSPTAGSVREFTRIFFADFPTEEIESHNFAMSIGAGSQVGPDLRRHWRGCRSFSFSSS
jgi:hypothetical protein